MPLCAHVELTCIYVEDFMCARVNFHVIFISIFYVRAHVIDNMWTRALEKLFTHVYMIYCNIINKLKWYSSQFWAGDHFLLLKIYSSKL